MEMPLRKGSDHLAPSVAYHLDGAVPVGPVDRDPPVAETVEGLRRGESEAVPSPGRDESNAGGSGVKEAVGRRVTAPVMGDFEDRAAEPGRVGEEALLSRDADVARKENGSLAEGEPENEGVFIGVTLPFGLRERRKRFHPGATG